MKDGQFRIELESMALQKGLIGCALVDVDTGMVWHAAGQLKNLQQIAEAASDYWRLYQRQRAHIDYLGNLQAQILVHEQGRLTIVSCSPSALLITLSEEKSGVNWNAWRQKVLALKNMLLRR